MGIATASELVASVEAAVGDGSLAPGQRLPSVRAQAAELGLAPNTVAAAYRRLRERGVVVGRGRQGTVVAPLAATPAAAPPAADDAVDALTGTPDPTRLPSLARLLRRVDYLDGVAYGQPLLLPALATAAKANFHADDIDATNLTVTNGAMDAIERVLDAQHLAPGDRVAVEDPGHPPVHQLARRKGLELVAVPVDDEGPTIAGLRAAVNRGIRAAIVTPRAQNPTGGALTEARATALAETLDGSPDTFLVLDDHAGTVAGTPYVGIDPPGDRWSVVRSLAKCYGPDLRVAVVAGDARTITAVDIGMQNGPGWVSHILQSLAAHLLTDDSVARAIGETAESYTSRRQRLIDLLTEAGIAATGRSGLNVWIPVTDEQAAVDGCRAHGYAIRAAGRHRLVSAPAVRVTVSTLTDEQVDEVGDALVTTLRPHTTRSATM